MGLSSSLLSLQKHITFTKGFHMKSCKITTFHFDAITLGATFENVALSIFDLAYIHHFLRVLLFLCMVNYLFVFSILCLSFQHSLARSYFAFCTVFLLFKGKVMLSQMSGNKKCDDDIWSYTIFKNVLAIHVNIAC